MKMFKIHSRMKQFPSQTFHYYLKCSSFAAAVKYATEYLTPDCMEIWQVEIYEGTIPEHEEVFENVFEKKI